MEEIMNKEKSKSSNLSIAKNYRTKEIEPSSE
jgi:hypothetical protein